MKRLVFFAVLICVISSSFAAESIDAEKKKLIDKLMEQTGQSSITMGKQFSDMFVQQMTRVIQQSNPNVEAQAFVILEEEIQAVINNELREGGPFQTMMYPIYAKHFSAAELTEMIRFNESPIGQKLIQTMPLITQESMIAGQQLGASMGPLIQQRLLARFQKEGISLQ